MVHFHALIRLDGPKTSDGFAPAPAAVDAVLLARLVEEAVRKVRGSPCPASTARPGTTHPDSSRLAGSWTPDPSAPAAAPTTPTAPSPPEQVAGYLAKYATKSADDTGATDNPDHQRLRATARRLAARAMGDGPHELLGKWVHRLGFRGHFASKSRRYSITSAQSAEPAAAPRP